MQPKYKKIMFLLLLNNLIISMNFGLVTTGILYNYNSTASNTVIPNIVKGGDGDLSELATWLGFDRITQTMKNKISAGVAPRFAIIDNGFTGDMYNEHPNPFTRLAWTSYEICTTMLKKLNHEK